MTTAAARQNSGIKVLVVDDDPIVLQVIHEWLAEAGYTVHVREQALGTANWVASEQPDIVLLDVSMPALAGNDLTQLLRRNRQTAGVAVILFSARDEGELADLARNSGAMGAIQKTSNKQTFLTQFERFVARQRARHP